MNKQELNAKILSRVGRKSYGLIAKELGITRNVVAGVVFRNRWPIAKRIASPNGSPNKSGTGHHGGGCYAKKKLPCGRASWRVSA